MNRVFLTVDTECHDIKRENQYIWGKCRSGEYGIRYILKIARELSIPVNFFVDFAEMDVYGKRYIKKIVDTIENGKQPVFLHLHPNYISKDDKKTYLWEYDEKLQEKIIARGESIYEEIMGKKPKAFRAGRYGINDTTLEILSKLWPGIIDFSYLGEYGKMCHVQEETVKTKTQFRNYKEIGLMPTTGFIGFDLFGIKKRIGVDASEMSVTEFKEFIKKANGRDFVLTMHSWNFIEKYIFLPHYVGRNNGAVRRFQKMVKIAEENGYRFADINLEGFTEQQNGDIEYNASDNWIKKVRSLGINFWRFQNTAKLSKKYLYIYTIFYVSFGMMLFYFLKK